MEPSRGRLRWGRERRPGSGEAGVASQAEIRRYLAPDHVDRRASRRAWFEVQQHRQRREGRKLAAPRADLASPARSVLMAAKALLRHTVKKRAELQVVIDHLEGRIRGNHAIGAFSGGARLGRRRGRIRAEDVPFTRREGPRLSRPENARTAREAHAVSVTDALQDDIRRDHLDFGLGHSRLSEKPWLFGERNQEDSRGALAHFTSNGTVRPLWS